jgi:MFS family permease
MTNERMDYSRKWYVMAAVGMSILLSTIDATIVNIALPTLVRDLDTDFPTVQWVVLSYLLIQATLMLSSIYLRIHCFHHRFGSLWAGAFGLLVDWLQDGSGRWRGHAVSPGDGYNHRVLSPV